MHIIASHSTITSTSEKLSNNKLVRKNSLSSALMATNISKDFNIPKRKTSVNSINFDKSLHMTKDFKKMLSCQNLHAPNSIFGEITINDYKINDINAMKACLGEEYNNSTRNCFTNSINLNEKKTRSRGYNKKYHTTHRSRSPSRSSVRSENISKKEKYSLTLKNNFDDNYNHSLNSPSNSTTNTFNQNDEISSSSSDNYNSSYIKLSLLSKKEEIFDIYYTGVIFKKMDFLPMHFCANCSHFVLGDMNELVRNIIKEAKQLVNGEACSLFLLDRENNELVAEVFEENCKTGEYLKEIRMPIDQGIVGYVARTGQTQNVPDVNSNPYFYPKIDEKTGFVTRNILCVPIRDNTSGDLVGVAEVCNKIGAPSFTKHDEKIANTFTILCGMSISHCLLYRKLQEYHRRNHMAAEVLVQGSTMSISPEDILRLSFRKIPEPTSFHHNFNSFQFIPRSIGTGDIYVEASLSMFDELGFIEKYRIRQSTLAKFLLMVQRGYRDVPYHNWSHAFAVAHFCYLLLKLPTVKKALTDLQRLSLLVACLCHDIDHRGTTNAFQLQSKTPLAQLYSSEGSVLERHHFAQTVTILGMDECNIFNQLSRSQYQTVLGHIRQVILATDIAVHLSRADDIRRMVETGFDPQNKDHNDRFLCLLMTASDLSDQSKDFRNTKSIAENIYKEFFSQGDLEKQMGNTPNEMMDREKACVPLIQLNFMDKVALPVFYNLAQLLDELEPTYKTLQTNRRCWEILNELIQEKNDSFKGLEYLRDSELETCVIERFKKEVESEKNLSN